jgi:hypothetical protein
LLEEAVPSVRFSLHERGEEYTHEAIKEALIAWIEQRIESLLEDATFHTVEGDPTFAQGRRDFQNFLKRHS